MMFDPLQLAQLTARKRSKIIMFWYQQIVIMMLAYGVFRIDGRGFGTTPPEIDLKSIAHFLSSGDAFVLVVYWLIATLIVRFALNAPFVGIGRLLTRRLTKQRLFKLAKDFHFAHFFGDPPKHAYKGKWFNYIRPFIEDEDSAFVKKFILKPVHVIGSSSTGTLIVLLLFKFKSPVMDLVTGAMWLWTVYFWFNMTMIFQLHFSLSRNRRKLTRVIAFLDTVQMSSDMTTVFKVPVNYITVAEKANVNSTAGSLD